MNQINEAIKRELEIIKAEGLYKEERIITSPQSANIETTQNPSVLNFCANNYLDYHLTRT